MDHKISKPISVVPTAASPPLPQHTVELTPPKTVKRKGSMADMLMRLTASTASSRGKMQEPRSASSPQRLLKTSQSMHSLKIGSVSPPRSARSHNRTLSNPGKMPAISRPIAVPFSQIQHDYTSPRAPHQTTGSPSSSLMSVSSSGSDGSRSSPHGSSHVSLGTPRRPAPLPPSQATSLQPRTKRGPGSFAPAGSRGGAAAERNTATDAAGVMHSAPSHAPNNAPDSVSTAPRAPKSGATTPIISDEPLKVGRSRQNPDKSRLAESKKNPEYVKRSPKLPQLEQLDTVGLGLDLGASSVRKRVASAPAPPSGSTATMPRSMSHLIQQQQHRQSESQALQVEQGALASTGSPRSLRKVQPLQPQSRSEQSRRQFSQPQQSLQQKQQRQPQQQQLEERPPPQQRSPSLQKAPAQQRAQPQRSRPAQGHSPAGLGISSRTQQMQERAAELQSLAKSSAKPKQPEVETPVLKQTGFADAPEISPLKTPQMGRSNGATTPPSSAVPNQSREIASLRHKLSQLEIKYHALQDQRDQDLLNLQNVSSDLCVVQASRDSLQQQVIAYERAQKDMKRRLDMLQKNLTRSQRVVRVLEANLEESKVALEEKHMENYALKRTVTRAARPKPPGEETKEHHAKGGMLSPPNSVSDVGDGSEHDSDTPTIKG